MKYVLFSGISSPLSNMHPAPMLLWGKQFHSSEQAYMFAKAAMFNDTEIENAILKADSPYEAKKLGRMVKDFDYRRWDHHKDKIMHDILIEKFLQNKDLQDHLMSYHMDSLYVECAPWDKYWGNGISIEESRKIEPNKWPGKNKLGHILKAIRMHIHLSIS